MSRLRSPGHIARCVAVLTLAAAPARANDLFALRLELDGGSMLSDFQRNADPAAYGGEVKDLGFTFHAAVRVGWSVVDALSLQASLSNWVFPTSEGRETGWVFAPMLGARFEPQIGSAGRLFVDGNLGLAFTGEERALQLDLGLGFEFRVSDAISLGPVIRYAQTVQPDTTDDGQPQRYPDDARYLGGGLSISFHTTPRAGGDEPEGPEDRDEDGVPDPEDQCPNVSAGPRADHARRGCPVQDSDSDGVPDGADLCPNTAPGDRPDEFRRGCPARDRDNDGVTDDRDLCVEVPQGPLVDPMRAGCPAPDGDQDGIPDHADACPEFPPGPSPDATRPGCPEGDRDGDGYVDSHDQCPDAAETFNNVTDEDGCPEAAVAPMVEIRSGTIELQGNPVSFATSSDRIIGRRSFETLDALVAVLRAHTEITRVDIQGHTDAVGDRDANVDLSQRRARAVRMYLIDHGILVDRVEAHGFGPDRPVASNDTIEGRAANRRVEVHIVGIQSGAPARRR